MKILTSLLTLFYIIPLSAVELERDAKSFNAEGVIVTTTPIRTAP